MLGPVDLDRTPVAIYREWLQSLPIVKVVRDAEGVGRYVVCAWLDEINNPNPAARSWLDEVTNPNPAARSWLDEINNPNPTARSWLDEVNNPNPRARAWLDEVNNPNPRARAWLDEVNNPNPTARAWLDEIGNPNPTARAWLDEVTNPRVQRQPAGVITRGGANEVAFSRPQGRVRVWLPDDMAAGDTISGSVISEPAGRTETERRASSDTLEGYVVDVGGARAKVSAGRFTFTVPASMTRMTIGLFDQTNRVADASLNTSPPSTGGPAHVVIPTVGQAGRPLEIPGHFDGDSANTSISVGGKPGEVIAESPRQAVIWTPPEPAAATRITVVENGQTTEGPYRNVRIELASPRTELLRGDQTSFHLQVSGLQDLAHPVAVRLEASSSVQVAGGNVQTISIAPNDVGPGGVYQTDRTLQAIENGPFTVTGTLVGAGP